MWQVAVGDLATNIDLVDWPPALIQDGILTWRNRSVGRVRELIQASYDT